MSMEYRDDKYAAERAWFPGIWFDIFIGIPLILAFACLLVWCGGCDDPHLSYVAPSYDNNGKQLDENTP